MASQFCIKFSSESKVFVSRHLPGHHSSWCHVELLWKTSMLGPLQNPIGLQMKSLIQWLQNASTKTRNVDQFCVPEADLWPRGPRTPPMPNCLWLMLVLGTLQVTCSMLLCCSSSLRFLPITNFCKTVHNERQRDPNWERCNFGNLNIKGVTTCKFKRQGLSEWLIQLTIRSLTTH